MSFQVHVPDGDEECTRCFNLVIEVLVVSSDRRRKSEGHFRQSFNLVIEVLVVSSLLRVVECLGSLECFNLVIEVLVVSRAPCGKPYRTRLNSGYFCERGILS